jgi:hypothetical protein
MMDTPINETLPATGSTPVEVKLPADFIASDFAIQARGDVDMIIGTVSTIPTTGAYWTIKAGSAINLKKISGGGNLTLFYAVSGSSADTVEVIPLRA